MGKKSSKIVDLFRAAGRLAYEWRDTLTYTGLAAATSVGLAMTGNDPWVLGGASLACSIREGIRTESWRKHSSHMILASDYSRKDINPEAFKISALTGYCYAFTLFSATQTGNYFISEPSSSSFFVLMGAAFYHLALKNTRKAGGIREVLKNYQKMWNYHEDDDDEGGIAQGVKKKAPPSKDGIISRIPVFGMRRGISLNGPR